jgi:hypothetical protein
MFQWEAKVQRCQKEFDDISAEIKREMERFEINRAKDFKATIVKYLQDQMAHQQQVKTKSFFLLSSNKVSKTNKFLDHEILGNLSACC